MTLFLDTAKVEEIETAMDWGVIRGVTTNQSIFKKSKMDFTMEAYIDRIAEICETVKGPTSIELTNTSGSIDDLIHEAEYLFDIDHDRIVIKVPMWGDGKGLCVTKELTDRGIPVNATCLMNAQQTILAMEAGARYVSLFYNRILDFNDKNLMAVENVFKLSHIYLLEHGADWNPPAEIIAGSIRSPLDVPNAFAFGADIVTVSFDVLKSMVQHPRTESTIKEFDESWQKLISGVKDDESK